MIQSLRSWPHHRQFSRCFPPSMCPVKYLIPVFFHNFRGYDSHLFIHQFRFHKEPAIKVIGQNMEKYLQIQLDDNIVFRDSLQHLFSSLDALSVSLAKSGRENFALAVMQRQTRSYSTEKADSVLIIYTTFCGSQKQHCLHVSNISVN